MQEQEAQTIIDEPRDGGRRARPARGGPGDARARCRAGRLHRRAGLRQGAFFLRLPGARRGCPCCMGVFGA